MEARLDAFDVVGDDQVGDGDQLPLGAEDGQAGRAQTLAQDIHGAVGQGQDVGDFRIADGNVGEGHVELENLRLVYGDDEFAGMHPNLLLDPDLRAAGRRLGHRLGTDRGGHERTRQKGRRPDQHGRQGALAFGRPAPSNECS